MTEHDLSGLDGLLDDLDIEEKGPEDPRAAKLLALFEKAKATYTAKIDYPTCVPSPAQLLAQRKSDRTGSTTQEWTANHLYTQGHFELCLSYVTSFAVSMHINFPFDIKIVETHLKEYDSSQTALRRSKAERDLSKNWGVIKDVIDVGIRSLLTLRRIQPSLTTLTTWMPDSASGYRQAQVHLTILASGFLSFCMREVRVGAGDTRRGYSGMVVKSPVGKLVVDMEKVNIQNWTVTHGLALTAGDLALDLGLYRTAIEAHSLFLACRGQMWRVLVALSNELYCYSEVLKKQDSVNEAGLRALQVVAKTSVVSALQAIPRPRRLELAKLILIEHTVIPSNWIKDALEGKQQESGGFEDEDDLLFNGLLQPLTRGQYQGWSMVPEEVGIALIKVVFAKKSGLIVIYSKFPTYIKEYKGRLENVNAANKHGQEWNGELDVGDEDEGEGGPRSVRTL
uniref:Uncharacterized protein n=1 Tax=Melanopsichium pennsylvanicum 4 TaxID=1398559 RepID=A0A077QSF8_9BASI|nr:hypothetical protein BN887_04068 [Melanopsichium pennsylvanicum 4]